MPQRRLGRAGSDPSIFEQNRPMKKEHYHFNVVLRPEPEGESMRAKKLPNTDSIQELAKFWDRHDLTDFAQALEEVGEPLFARSKHLTPQPPSGDASVTVGFRAGSLVLLPKQRPNLSNVVRQNCAKKPTSG